MTSWRVGLDAMGRVVAEFQGHLAEEEGKKAAVAFLAALGPGSRVVVFNLRAMTSYDSGARRAWVEALMPHRHRFERIEVRGGSALARMGAATLAMLIRVPIEFV